MINKNFIFLAGHHRSGTSLLHTLIREHPMISGFDKTGVPEDEGQHLQSVYDAANKLGGPGKYIFNENSYMDENHILATEKSARTIMEQWESHYDTNLPYLLEKSPPNLIRTRFLQKIFPNSKFIVTLRHPLAVGYATQKWSKTSIKSLIEHTLRGYEIFYRDQPFLKASYVMRYEDFVQSPQKELEKIFDFLGLDCPPINLVVKSEINEKYFSMWEKNRRNQLKKFFFSVGDDLEDRFAALGYSILDYNKK